MSTLDGHLPLRGGIACECGWSAGLSLNDTRSDARQHLRHLAAVVAEWLGSDEAAEVVVDAGAAALGYHPLPETYIKVVAASLVALAAHAKGEAT